MKCYVLVYPRPMGVYPAIYLTKPDIKPDPEDPWNDVHMEEFDDELSAARYIQNYLGHMYKDALDTFGDGKIQIIE